ncbi:hypothetical protein CUN85_12005 [Methanolobus halotolerans]|uniref:Uncharacterized protein n=2 Tax=Methanolobus halotolerans TaxID=2052935 RepID=A0A4E0Q2M4_9EURY|nr:hypothetical protein CUN85_12005 [Methanolobus halotolerans]
MNSYYAKCIPKTFDLCKEEFPEIVTVYRSGDITSEHKSKMEAYVPEGKADDIPRSFVLTFSKKCRIKYRENIFYYIPYKQRHIVFKYIIETPDQLRWIIHPISKSADIRRKYAELGRQLSILESENIDVAGVIILTSEKILKRLHTIEWPQNTFFSYYKED